MKYTLLYILSLCLLVTGCTRELSEAPKGTDSGNWLPALTRAAKGTEATIAGFSSEKTDKATFSETVICDNEKDNIWKWKNTSFTPPSLKEIALLTATIPPISISSATTTLYQSSLSSYPNGLQLGSAPAKIDAVNAIKVYHRLAQLDLDCEGNHTLNNTIDLYLASSAEVDFRTATIKTASGEKTSYPQSLEKKRRITLTILPQTFQKGDILFQYQYDDTKYTYRLEKDLVVSNNQCLKVRISQGEEDEEPIPGGGGSGGGDDDKPNPPATVKVSVTTSTITEWVEGSGSEVPVK